MHQVHVHKEQDFRLRVVWAKAHTSAKEMTQQKRQIAMTNDEATELAQGGATLDGAEFWRSTWRRERIKFASTYMRPLSMWRPFIVKWRILKTWKKSQEK